MKKGLFRLMRFFIKSNIHKKKHNQNQCSANLGACTDIQNVIHNCSNNSSAFTEATKKNIPKNKFHVNTAIVLRLISTIFGAINTSAKYPAAKLTNNPDKDFSQGLVKNILIKITVAEYLKAYNVKTLYSSGSINY